MSLQRCIASLRERVSRKRYRNNGPQEDDPHVEVPEPFVGEPLHTQDDPRVEVPEPFVGEPLHTQDDTRYPPVIYTTTYSVGFIPYPAIVPGEYPVQQITRVVWSVSRKQKTINGENMKVLNMDSPSKPILKCMMGGSGQWNSGYYHTADTGVTLPHTTDMNYSSYRDSLIQDTDSDTRDDLGEDMKARTTSFDNCYVGGIVPLAMRMLIGFSAYEPVRIVPWSFRYGVTSIYMVRSGTFPGLSLLDRTTEPTSGNKQEELSDEGETVVCEDSESYRTKSADVGVPHQTLACNHSHKDALPCGSPNYGDYIHYKEKDCCDSIGNWEMVSETGEQTLPKKEIESVQLPSAHDPPVTIIEELEDSTVVEQTREGVPRNDQQTLQEYLSYENLNTQSIYIPMGEELQVISLSDDDEEEEAKETIPRQIRYPVFRTTRRDLPVLDGGEMYESGKM
jgi:hypothetical protein